MTYMHHLAHCKTLGIRPLSYVDFLRTRDLIEGAR